MLCQTDLTGVCCSFSGSPFISFDMVLCAVLSVGVHSGFDFPSVKLTVFGD